MGKVLAKMGCYPPHYQDLKIVVKPQSNPEYWAVEILHYQVRVVNVIHDMIYWFLYDAFI